MWLLRMVEFSVEVPWFKSLSGPRLVVHMVKFSHLEWRGFPGSNPTHYSLCVLSLCASTVYYLCVLALCTISVY